MGLRRVRGGGSLAGSGSVGAGRHLAAAGWPVRLGLLGERSRLSGDAGHHAALWRGEAEGLSADLIDDAELVVDALFGAGLTRPLEGLAREICEAVIARALPVAAVDVPSGLSGDSGRPDGALCLQADVTVTFFRKKPGHLLLPGRALCGEVQVADIGIPEAVLSDIEPATFENAPALWRDRLPRRRAEDHKYRFGHALISGGAEMTGAGRLAARAALRIGAGLVTVACPRAAWPIYAADSPSVITLPLDRPRQFDTVMEDPRKTAVLIGPGHGVDQETGRRASLALLSDKAVVLDADALTVFQDEPEALLAMAGARTVLTPHDGEFARLFPDLEGDRLTRARAAAARAGAVVVLKGPDTVIADPDGRAAINGNAPPDLATAGTGDVLAGMIVGLLAQGLDGFTAAAAAVWMHGAAAARVGVGLIAEDLPHRLLEIRRLIDEN